MSIPEINDITDADYHVWFEDGVVFFEGSLRLNGAEAYAPITDMLKKVLDLDLAVVQLDFTSLQFLNSSGINTLLKYAISLREKQKQISDLKLIVKGTKNIPWQQKSLPNFQRFFKASEIHIN